MGEVGGRRCSKGNLTIRNFAVDSIGHIYVTVEGSRGELRKYGPTGTLESVLNPEFETEGLAVDAADNLYAKQRDVSITAPRPLIHFFTKYASSGAVLARFDYEIRTGFVVPALAAYLEAPGEVLHLYSSEGAGGIRDRSLPPSGPVLTPLPCQVKGNVGNNFATLQGEVNPEGKASGFKFEYLTQAKFEAEGGFANAQSSTEVSLASGAADFVLHEAAQKIEGLETETFYHCRVVAKNADGGPILGAEGVFKTSEGFEFGPAWSSHVGETTATLFVEGNPHGLEATGQVEYVTDAQYQASKFSEALSAPTPELDFFAGEEMVQRSVDLSGLAPGTLYHYRLRARNGLPPEGVVCPEKKAECPEFEHTFKTYLPEADEADGRRYELVSPGEKNSAEVAVPGNAGGLVEPRSIQIQAGAGDGHAVTYTSWSSFGAGEGGAGDQPVSLQAHRSRLGDGEHLALRLHLRSALPPLCRLQPRPHTGCLQNPRTAAGARMSQK